MDRKSLKGIGPIAVLAMACMLTLNPAARAARIKDITDIEGIRSNQLYGFGLVVGLAGTGGGGDFTSDLAGNMLEKMRVGRGLSELDASNIAAVIVMAELPPFAAKGTTIDLIVNSFDESQSLRGGVLLLTPLVGADGQVYAVAQGPVTVGGFAFGGEAAAAQQGHPTVGRIPNGAIVEKEVGTTFLDGCAIALCLHQPDFVTARRIASAVESNTDATTEIVSAGKIKVVLDPPLAPNELMRQISEIQSLEVDPDSRAVVVINERTGTVVAGQNVTISTVAVSHGNLTVITEEVAQVVQPAPLSEGTTVVVPRTAMRIIESPLKEGGLTVLNKGTTVSEVAGALNMLGASPRDIISIFMAMKEAGALHAELKVM